MLYVCFIYALYLTNNTLCFILLAICKKELETGQMQVNAKLSEPTVAADQGFKGKQERVPSIALILPSYKIFHVQMLELLYLIAQNNLGTG